LGGLLEAGGDAPELLELGDAAFDEVALSIEMGVELVFAGPGGAARDDRLGVLLGDRRADVIGIVGGVGDDRLGRRILQQARAA